MTDIAAWVRRSTAAQGLPEKIEDAETIVQLVALLRALLRRPNSDRWKKVA